MKTFITMSAIVAALAIGSASFAGPGPGQPGLGERVAKRSKETAEKTREGSAYALKGSSQPQRSDMDQPERDRTSISHRRFPGDAN